MKAILLRRPGGPSALEYVDGPTPRTCEGEVLVKADTIGVSMPEVLVRKGVYARMPPLPAIPGIELAGTVVEQGAGTIEPAIGEPVFVSARDLPVRAGCYAEYIAVPAYAAHPLPPGCSLEPPTRKRPPRTEAALPRLGPATLGQRHPSTAGWRGAAVRAADRSRIHDLPQGHRSAGSTRSRPRSQARDLAPPRSSLVGSSPAECSASPY